ncbi:hypothetical protein AJ78_08740 [Emergomyces pasteurianus Ep9510]|uniref:SnoaL-like domain-containing protein n=1 Tax=Emergomyces pasteurianus Ep9510 TaxID=1447872 RepID=A0A1J9Q2F6_9EURO|nr:hypothetical protein AJ78_08740 [Emergomyces pasteurianus Ep9510]
MDIHEDPVVLPSAPPTQLGPNLTLQPPLSRRGHGPGLLLVLSDNIALDKTKETVDPPPVLKWAEEGYAVVEVRIPASATAGSSAPSAVRQGLEALKELAECDVKDKFGLIVYDASILTSEDIVSLSNIPEIVGIASYGEDVAIYSNNNNNSKQPPKLLHLPGNGTTTATPTDDHITIHKYPNAKSPNFVIPQHPDFIPSAGAMAHTRTLSFLKSKIGGPLFDLEAIWEEHTYFEFGDRSVNKTMATMVQEPYINSIPTMTGAIGREGVTNFYRNHFIFNSPDDSNLELISRSISINCIIDEFIFSCTHDQMMDWLIPAIPATNRFIQVPMVSVINIRGDRLYHEHLWWDQAGLLRQLGLLPEYLPYPYPYPLADDGEAGNDKKYEYKVPVAGVESAEKLRDEGSVPSSRMIREGVIREARS